MAMTIHLWTFDAQPSVIEEKVCDTEVVWANTDSGSFVVGRLERQGNCIHGGNADERLLQTENKGQHIE